MRHVEGMHDGDWLLGHSPATTLPARLCRECGQSMPRFDTSPCHRCVSRHVKEAIQAYEHFKRPPEYVI